jgi:hypothetical protein
LIDGKLRTKKRTGTTKDYPLPATWSRAFIQYVSILSEFEKFNGLTRHFSPSMSVSLSQTYTWERVVVLALTFHKERLLDIHDKKAWQIPSDVVDEHLRGALGPAKPTTNPSTEYFKQFMLTTRIPMLSPPRGIEPTAPLVYSLGPL